MGKKQKKPGKGKEKTERKAAKGEEKRARREARKVGEEDDIDAILVSNPSPPSIPPAPFHAAQVQPLLAALWRLLVLLCFRVPLCLLPALAAAEITQARDCVKFRISEAFRAVLSMD